MSERMPKKQPPDMFCKKRRAQKFRKIHRKTPVLEFFFNEVAGLEFNENLKKALENPGIYLKCCFQFCVIEIRVMFYLISSNLKLISFICLV